MTAALTTKLDKDLPIFMPRKVNLESVNTLTNTIIGVVGTLISLLGIYLSYVAANQDQKVQLLFPIRLTLIILGLTFISTILTALIQLFYLDKKKRIATSFKYFDAHPVVEESIIGNIDHNTISNSDKECLNRIQTVVDTNLFWESSWLGSGGGDLVGSILVNEGKNYRGKIPVIKEEFERKKIDVLVIKCSHVIGGWWTAIIHGKNGKPTLNNWEGNLYNLNGVDFLTFWARSSELISSPQKESDNPKGYPICYVRLEDVNNISSDSVVIIVKNHWTQFKLPISKFLYSTDLYKDYNAFGRQFYFERKGVFKKDKTMQVMFGCTHEMPAQNCTFEFFDIRFE